jgi:hypothetical protein
MVRIRFTFKTGCDNNTTFQTHGVSTFRPIEGRKETIGPMNHIGQILIRHETQTNRGKDNMPVSKQPHQYWTKESTVSHHLLLI